MLLWGVYWVAGSASVHQTTPEGSGPAACLALAAAAHHGLCPGTGSDSTPATQTTVLVRIELGQAVIAISGAGANKSSRHVRCAGAVLDH